MMNELNLKQSPIVLLWRFAAIEAGALLLYFIATLFGNAKYEFYNQLFFTNIISYQMAKMLFLSGVQFAVTVYAFLSWYYESYIIRHDSVTHHRGIVLKRERVFPIHSVTAYKTSANFAGKLFHTGSIRMMNGNESFKLANVSRPELLAEKIKSGDLHGTKAVKAPDVHALMKENEHEGLEFKSSLRYDYRTGQATRDVEKSAMKTVAALLNSKGGHLVLGVNDKREPVGIGKDYATLQRKDADGFENHFTQSFNNMIGPEFRNLIKLWFHPMGEAELCVVQVSPSPRPVYLKADNTEHFYVRTGNISAALKLSEMDAYARTRWPQRA